MEKFNLKWNDFQVNVSKSFGLFRNEKYLQDITLLSEDLNHFKAHKLVLSASSEYFRNILQKTNVSSETLLCLDGVSSTDLQNVLDYVYNGEVKIHQGDLDHFLGVAQKLKLEGLIANGDEANEEKMETVQENFYNALKEEDTGVEEISKTFHTQKIQKPRQERTVVAIQNDENISADEHKQRLNDNIQMNEDETVTCRICGKTFGTRNARANARRHVEVHVEGLIYNCTQCDKTFRSKNSLTVHMYRFHN